MSHVSTVANAFPLRLSFAVEHEELRNVQCTLQELRNVQCTVQELRNVQCTLQHIPDALLDVLFLEHIPVALPGAQE